MQGKDGNARPLWCPGKPWVWASWWCLGAERMSRGLLASATDGQQCKALWCPGKSWDPGPGCGQALVVVLVVQRGWAEAEAERLQLAAGY